MVDCSCDVVHYRLTWPFWCVYNRCWTWKGIWFSFVHMWSN